jgi:CheY-like chemotaxis protein
VNHPILIIDDDLDIRDALSDTLEDQGYRVFTAANGHDALRLLRDGGVAPSMILLDLMMPVMDGYAFLDERRRDPALAAIPVAVITAGNRVDPARLGGPVPVIPKPIELPRLVAVMEQLGAGGPA